MRLTILQTQIVWAEIATNLRRVEQKIATLLGKTDMVVLPEMFTTGFCTEDETLSEPMGGQTHTTLLRWSAKYQLAIVGSFLVQEGKKMANRGFIATPNGDFHIYDKRHLFSIGGEKERMNPGKTNDIFHYMGVNIRLQICYDLRFPVWSRNVNNAYDLLIYVANFPAVRIGVWDTLLPARAIENQAYVCGVNNVGTDGKGLYYSGHSAVYDAKGLPTTTIAKEGEEDLQTVSIDVEALRRFRTKFPVWKDADTFYF